MVRESCCRNRYRGYMSGGCWGAVMGYTANTGEPWEPSRVQTAGVSSDSQRCLQIHAGLSCRAVTAQAAAMSLI
jgi:hypothetical protein